MVNKVKIINDIKIISEQVGVAVFSYNDIHNEQIDNEYHYDYQSVINQVSRVKQISYDDTEKILVERGILKPLPGGEYEVDVGASTRGGGGLNYGDVFFSHTSNDYHTNLHELAHSLQVKYNLFDSDKMRSLYDIAQTGLKPSENIENKLLDKSNYYLFLNEQHADAFASAVLMLRSESTMDFIKQSSIALANGENNMLAGVLSFGNTEFGVEGKNSKFYANKPVMQELVKTIKQIRKEGKNAEFFDTNGVINSEKVAKLCEDIVMRSAYSPRTINAFFNYDITDTHSSLEQGWRKHALGSMVKALPATIISWSSENVLERLKDIRRHRKLRSQQMEKMMNFASQKQIHKDPEMHALKEYERLKTKITLLDFKMPQEHIGFNLEDKLSIMMKHQMPYNLIDNRVNNLKEDSSIKRLIMKYEYKKELKNINRLLMENKDNIYFRNLINSEVSPNQIIKMIREKDKNPQNNVVAESNLKPQKMYDTFIAHDIKSVTDKIQVFADKYQVNGPIKSELIKIMMSRPQQANYLVTRDKLADNISFINDTFGVKKRQFKKDLGIVLDAIGANHYYNQEMPKYKNIMENLKQVPIEKIPETINQCVAQEKEDRLSRIILKDKAYDNIMKMEDFMEHKGDEYKEATLETIKSLAVLNKEEREEVLKNQLKEIKEDLQPFIQNLPEEAISNEDMDNLKIETVSTKSDKKLTKNSETKDDVDSFETSLDKERIAVLSGRAEQSTKTVIQSEDKSVVEQMTEQVPMPKIQEPTKLNNISPKPSEQKISAEPMSKQLSGKVSDMSKKEKATFFVNLRKGVNMLLSKVSFGKEKTTENQVTQNRETSIVQTQVINKVTAQGR